MSQAYTPGLKRKESLLIRKTRMLPIPGELIVNAGDTVAGDTIVARADTPGEPEIVKVCALLGIDPEEIEKYMTKKESDSVKADEIIASYRALFGLIKSDCKSPINGTVESVSQITGQAIIRRHPTPININAYIPGKVVEIIQNEGVIIETYAAFIQGAFGIGGENHGEIKMASETPHDILTEEQITPECKGKVLIGGSMVTAAALKKAIDTGVRGILVGGIMDKDLTDFLGYRIGVAITGHENIGLTLVATEGFGMMNMLEKTFSILKENEGRMACINGTTQIRAGVIRPEVIIPLSREEEVSTASGAAEDERSDGMAAGTLVRIIQEPYFGVVGHVRSLPPELARVETESSVRIVEIELEDGERVLVPRANVEIIEE
jgi:transcription antitermination factor NusG